MADLLTELEGFLGKEAADKLRATPEAATRLSRASEILNYYDGETETPPPPPRRREDPPEPRPASAGSESLADIMAKLNDVTSKLGNIDKTVTDKVNEVVQTRGNELANNAIAISMRNMRELNRIDARHRADFGEDLDDDKLNTHIKKAVDEGRPFRTITQAYEDMTGQARIDKLTSTAREEGKREALKDRATANVPGVTPTGASPMLTMLHKRPNGTTDSGTHLDKAARALEARLADRGEQVA